MTSWDALEAYLSDLVTKVGGFSYVLRDSSGRHLAPRLPPPVGRRAIIDALTRKRLHERDTQGDTLQTAFEDPARTLVRYDARIDLFNAHSALLDEAVDVDFVRKGPGKRYVHREAPFPFIAERLLSSYLLIIDLRDVGAVDSQGVVLALEKAHSVLSDMLGGLPPDGGGDRALSHFQRPA